MNGQPARGDEVPANATRRAILKLSVGATGAALGIGGFVGSAAAWKRFDVDFRSSSEVWMIVGRDLEYDPPAVARVVVDDGEAVSCRTVEFVPENATTVPDEYGQANVVPYEAESGTVLGVLPYNRPGGDGDRFSRPRCLMGNDHVDASVKSESAPRADCVRAAVDGPWKENLRECWWEPVRSSDSDRPASTRLVPPDGSAGDEFGRSIAVNADGTVLLVGAPGVEPGDDAGGAAYVFRRRDGQWEQTATLVPDDETGLVEFGTALDLDASGTTAVIGHRRTDLDVDQRAFVFERDGTAWNQTATLAAPTSDRFGTLGGFGHAVALDDGGETAVCGAPWTGLSMGGAAVFGRGDDGWTESTTVFHNQGDDNFLGAAVDLAATGEVAFLGGPVRRTGPGEGGYVSVVPRDDGTWTPTHRLRSADRETRDNLGEAVACDGTGETVVAGDPQRDVDGETDRGRASVFVPADENWDESAHLLAPDGSPEDEFGSAAAVDDSGQTVLVGAPANDTLGATDAGAAYVFAANGGGGWSFREKLTASDGTGEDRFGTTVALDATGLTRAVGAPNASNADSGAVYVFDGS